MSRRKIKAGTQNLAVPIFVQDTTSTTGGGLAILYNTAGLAARYRRQGQDSYTSITLAAMTLGTWTSGGLVATGGVTGKHEFCPPNAAIAAGAEWVEIELYGAANMLPVLLEFELDTINYQASGGKIPATIASGDIATDAISAAAVSAAAVTKIQTGINTGAGTGGRTVTVTVTDGTDPVENATVRLTQGAETVSDRTDASGIALLYVDDATWSYVVTKTRYAAATGTVVVDGNESVPVTLSVLSLTPSDPDRTTGFLTVYDMAGDPAANVDVTLKITAFASGTTGIGIDSPERTQTTDANGLVEFVGLPRLATYSVKIGTASGSAQGTTEDAATTPLVNVLGEVAVA